MKLILATLSIALSFSTVAYGKTTKRSPASAQCLDLFKACIAEGNPTKSSGLCFQSISECQKSFSEANSTEFGGLVNKCDQIEKESGSLARTSANYCRALLVQFILSN